ncbi:MAG: Fur family transcriptional regulator [Bradymonadia bacterium]
MTPQEAVEALARHLDHKGLKYTRQRRLITEIFFDPERAGHHPSVEDMYEWVRKEDGSVGYATVYRTMKLLVEAGLASTRNLGDNHTRYEPHVEGEHHDHLVCLDCGTVIEFEDDAIEDRQEEVARSYGFSLGNHRMVLYGRCDGTYAQCPKKTEVSPSPTLVQIEDQL